MVYAAHGYGSIVFDGGRQQKDLEPGDFALIPAYDVYAPPPHCPERGGWLKTEADQIRHAEHQEVNHSGNELEWVVMRTGRKPVTVNLEGWS